MIVLPPRPLSSEDTMLQEVPFPVEDERCVAHSNTSRHVRRRHGSSLADDRSTAEVCFCHLSPAGSLGLPTTRGLGTLADGLRAANAAVRWPLCLKTSLPL